MLSWHEIITERKTFLGTVLTVIRTAGALESLAAAFMPMGRIFIIGESEIRAE